MDVDGALVAPAVFQNRIQASPARLNPLSAHQTKALRNQALRNRAHFCPIQIQVHLILYGQLTDTGNQAHLR